LVLNLSTPFSNEGEKEDATGAARVAHLKKRSRQAARIRTPGMQENRQGEEQHAHERGKQQRSDLRGGHAVIPLPTVDKRDPSYASTVAILLREGENSNETIVVDLASKASELNSCDFDLSHGLLAP
jgi:hypothetical protein